MSFKYTLIVIFYSLFMAACSVDDGKRGASGKSSLTVITEIFSGAACATGGQQIQVGVDRNNDSLLADEEISQTSYVCNGSTGSSSLIVATIENAGANCSNGGVKYESGIDDNKNNNLEFLEIDQTTFVCNGINGSDGSDGTDGLNSLVLVTAEAAGANCTNGGQKTQAGLDDNRDNVLQAGEVDQTAYVCNGTNGTGGSDGSDGTDGLNSLLLVTSEAVGANCTNGGQKTQTGLDDNRDNELQAGEVDQIAYVCNGTNGTDGSDGLDGSDGADGLNSLLLVTSEAVGANCTNGGQKTQIGLDDNRDNVLQAGEVDQTAYVCNGINGTDGSDGLDGIDGIDGLNSLLVVTAEPVGANCSHGGQKTETGLDDNRDNVLQVGEVDQTAYVCNGINGTDGSDGLDGIDGLNSLLVVTAEVAGVNCSYGGQKIETGLDDNRDNVLQVSEIDQASYVCNGSSDGVSSGDIVYVHSGHIDCSNDAPGTQGIPNCDLQIGISYVNNGGEVRVAAGQYNRVEVYKTVVLKGGYHPTTWDRDIENNISQINGDNSIDPVILIAANNVSIDGFDIVHQGLEIYAIRSNTDFTHSEILNNRINIVSARTNGAYGILVNAYSNIFNNQLYMTGAMTSMYGIQVSKETAVHNNEIVLEGNLSNEKIGISLGAGNAGEVTIANNTIIVSSSVQKSIGVKTLSGAPTPTLVNNNIYLGSSGTFSAGFFEDAWLCDACGANLINNNIFGTGTTVAVRYYSDQSTYVNETNIANINNCQDWLSSEGCGPLTSGNTMMDPGFLGFDIDDYRLGVTSPLIDSGVDPNDYNPTPIFIKAALHDLNFNLRTLPIDVGAYEYEQVWYKDNDADGFGIITNYIVIENQPAGYVNNAQDCNDSSSAINPGAEELYDSIDNNCNETVDEGFLVKTFYRDADGDGYGNPSITTQHIAAPTGYVANSSDCNDGSSAINPVTTELYDSIDNNCNGTIDEGFLVKTYYRDADGDGYGNPSLSTQNISPPNGYVLNGTDCDDTVYSLNNNCDNKKYIFITSTSHQANLGGLSGADQICQSLADSSPILAGGIYKAWLSTLTVSANDRMAHANSTYYETDGTGIATSFTSLTTLDSNRLIAIDHDENGNVIQTASRVWTNTSPTGTSWSTVDSRTTCGNWTSRTSASDYGGRTGLLGGMGGAWTSSSSRPCNEAHRLYCVRQ